MVSKVIGHKVHDSHNLSTNVIIFLSSMENGRQIVPETSTSVEGNISYFSQTTMYNGVSKAMSTSSA